MARTEVVKVRVSPRTKGKLIQIAERSQTTVSHVIRDLIGRVAISRLDDHSVRQDMATVRQLANTVLSIADAEAPACGPSSAVLLAEAGRRLRDLAARHLGPVA